MKSIMLKLRNKSFRVYLVTVLIICIVAFFQIYKSENLVYSIVIDAGSTGSRIHVFKLNHEDLDRKFSN